MIFHPVKSPTLLILLNIIYYILELSGEEFGINTFSMSMAGENMLNDQDLHRGLGKKKFQKSFKKFHKFYKKFQFFFFQIFFETFLKLFFFNFFLQFFFSNFVLKVK